MIRRRVAAVVAACATVTLVAGCSWDGIGSVPMPGAQGRGDGSYRVQVQMPDVTTLTPNSPVRVDDVTVGTVDRVEVQDWHALVTVSLDGSVRLPANAVAMIGQTSLLGSQHLELAAPDGEPAQGTLEPDAVIPLARAGAYPTTEQTLSSLSVVLNGGGLAQINDITTELDAALAGRAGTVRDLIPDLEQLTASLDRQTDNIVAAMDGLDRLSFTVQSQNEVLTRALDEMPEAFDVLIDDREQLTTAIASLGEMSDVASRLITRTRDDIATNLDGIAPTLRALADTGNHLTQVLGVLLTFPFPQAGINNSIRGDYANLAMTIDMTNDRLAKNFLAGTPIGPRLTGPEGILGRDAGLAGQATDPFRAPIDAPAPTAPPGESATIDVPGIGQFTIPGVPAP